MLPEPLSPDNQKLINRLKAKLAGGIGGHLFDLFDARGAKAAPRILNAVVDGPMGFGPLDRLLGDASISEILVNGLAPIFVERNGRLESTELAFQDQAHLRGIIERLSYVAGRSVNVAQPFVDGRLADGVRVNITIAPVALGGPYLTIRKYPRRMLSLGDLVGLGTLTDDAAQVLETAVRGRITMAISGPSASGKTTLLNALIAAIPDSERLIVVEETAELSLPDPQIVRLETRPPNLEGRGSITIEQLVRNALHMRPDRLIIGEVRGGEALAMVQAMLSGHHGSMTTVHANSPADALDRLTTMALMAREDLSPVAVERQVRSAVDLLVHLEHFPDGSRRVTCIAEAHAMSAPRPLTTLFVLDDPDGTLRPANRSTRVARLLAERGIAMPPVLKGEGHAAV